MKLNWKIIKSYICTGLASLAVIFGVTVMADDSDDRKSSSRNRGGERTNNNRSSQQRDDDRGRADMEAMRKRIEAGVRSGKIKREDAAKMLEGLRERMEAAKRGGVVRDNTSRDR